METRLYTTYDINKFAYLTPWFTQEKYEEFKKRLFIGLQKYTTSSKTRVVHHLYEKDLILPVTFTNGFKDLGVVFSKENKLLSEFLNASYFADFAVNKTVDVLIIEIRDIFDTITKERNLISEYQVHNIKKLIIEVNKLLDEFIDSFDYMKIADGAYFLFLRYLTSRIIKTQPTLKTKIFTIMQKIFTQILLKIYNKTLRAPIDDEIRKKFELISTYLILNYYGGLSPREIFVKIKATYGQGAVELLEKSKKLKLEKFNDIVDLMFETGIFKIQKSLFDTYMRKYFGELGYQIFETSLSEVVAFFCSINHKNVLFNAVNLFEKEGKHLEELILNYKSRIILADGRPPIKG